MVSSIVFAADHSAATISRRVARGELRRLASGIYTADIDADPTAVTAREWHTIVGGMLPAAVITDRSAPIGGPSTECSTSPMTPATARSTSPA